METRQVQANNAAELKTKIDAIIAEGAGFDIIQIVLCAKTDYLVVIKEVVP